MSFHRALLFSSIPMQHVQTIVTQTVFFFEALEDAVGLLLLSCFFNSFFYVNSLADMIFVMINFRHLSFRPKIQREIGYFEGNNKTEL